MTTSLVPLTVTSFALTAAGFGAWRTFTPWVGIPILILATTLLAKSYQVAQAAAPESAPEVH
ncbi:hypothetical protein SAMN05421595_2452 [Austwickia chelonae]|uniref:Uncharacterized protein n=1 Tax=Austwickia chelonae NBRC 105200 TaxID=1184607 RepID=K6VB22_9MICO|nr:hypothetical protein [Austwickia chelonae]GAB79443.1 hypothetical protein AUCHE_25_00240 [Austwickia chelonae NBRC 105200]SEW36758.1 hypothetical protein SAMN05421595_2452 [Austwickia chelonae]